MNRTMKTTPHPTTKKLRIIIAAASLALLTACGGGTGGETAAASEAAPTPQFLASSAAATGWVRCAVEDGICNVTGTKRVRYGLDGKWATLIRNTPVACNNAAFGDPYPGVDKVCDMIDLVEAAPPPAPAPDTTWTKCANEGATCTVPGTKQVRYGLNGKYAIRTATNSIQCANAVFGDPYSGVNKICEYAGTTATAPPPAPGGLLTDSVLGTSSFWYKPIPANVPLHPQSDAFMAEILRQKNTYYGTVNVNTASYASPLYIANASTPTQKVSYWDCTGKGYVDQNLVNQWASVPIPANAKQSAGTDGEMTIYNPATNTMWEFWQASNTNGQWKACWGGQMKNVSSGSGIWQNPYGTTATGLPFIGGQITAEELKRGEIKHVIGIALVDLEHANIFYWPATRSDGYNPRGVKNRIPEGARFRLDPTVNVDALNIQPAAKVIAKAAQKYGFVVWDHAGSLSIRAQNAISYTSQGQPNPYPALFNNQPEYSVLNGFPWERIQFLPKDYGKN